jgi:N-acetylglucosaminyldiphosphoundecaprenol N-acetyl-beta-D-mannosaminyltransferase
MDDFDRDVYCIGGLPFDAISLSKTMSLLRDAKHQNKSCFLTTPNLNFLALSQCDTAFRNSVIYSDIVIADGTPIVWLAKLLGVPIRERVAGSTLFEALGKEWRRKLSVYFFGGPTGVAAEASKHINEKSTGLTCVGYFSPGFGSLEEMSEASIIDNINASNADFLVVALGAKKGQAWILKNLDKIKTPLVSHLGAVINFEAKRLKRAPVRLQKIGLEWAWRIKEEPHLWKRYWDDGRFLLKFLFSKIIPHVLWLSLNSIRLKKASQKGSLFLDNSEAYAKLVFRGAIFDPVSEEIRSLLKESRYLQKNITLDFTEADYIGFNLFGLLLLLKKQLDKQNLDIKVVGLNKNMRKIFDWNCASFLID